MISGAKSDQLLSCREILKDVFSFNATSLEKRLNVLLMAGHNVVTLLCSDLLFWHYSGQDEGSGCYATGGHIVFMLQTSQAVRWRGRAAEKNRHISCCLESWFIMPADESPTN